MCMIMQGIPVAVDPALPQSIGALLNPIVGT